MKSNSCVCCGNSPVLRHARRNEVFWYCPNCRQETSPLEVSLQQLDRRFRAKTPQVV